MQLGGASVFILSILLPFWSVTIKDDRDMSQGQVEKLVEVLKKNREWYRDHIPKSALGKLNDAQRNREKLTVSLFGFSTSTGIIGLFFGLLIGASVLTPLFVSQIKSLDWILALIACFLGFIMAIMSLTWIFGSPAANAPPVLAQGKSLGPLAVFLASLAVCGGAALFALPHLKKPKSSSPTVASTN